MHTPPGRPRYRYSLGLTTATVVIASLVGIPGRATAEGLACTATSVAFSAPDQAAFTWTLPALITPYGTARIKVRPSASTGAFTTLVAQTVSTAGQRTTWAFISGLAAGLWTWRVEITTAGAMDYCTGSAVTITRLPAPTVVFAGPRITSDGWRSMGSGQTATVVVALGDDAPGTEWVRFQTSGFGWTSPVPSPGTLPASIVFAVRVYRRNAVGMMGSVATYALQTDATPPSVPVPEVASVEVGPAEASVGVTAATDTGSGVATHESLVVAADGSSGIWTAFSGTIVWVTADDVGGTLRVRACDRVANCSASAGVAVTAAPLPPVPIPIPTPPPAPPDPRPPVVRASPQITSLTAGRRSKGAGVVIVSLTRPAEVTFSFATGRKSVTLLRVWLGSGTTVVRLPALPRPATGTLMAHPVAGLLSGETVTAVVSLPGDGRRYEAARTRSRMRPGASAVLYDMDTAVCEVVHPSDGATGLGHRRGALRQEPSTSGLFERDDDSALLDKVSERSLRALTAAEIATTIREAIIDAPGNLVGIDEVSPFASDPRAPVLKGGQVPATDPGMFGARFAAALTSLDTPSPYGGTWASRVHVYIAPAVSSAMAAGAGPDHNLGRDGKPHFPTYRTVLGGLAHAGAVWIEMYHGYTGAATPFTVREWQRAPAAFVAEYAAAGGSVDRLHFLMAGSDAYPAGRLPASCTTPQVCMWSLAESTSAGRMILSNGVGAYRLGHQARPWLAEWLARAA
ncbi:MAG: hypothetical protein EXQ74_02150 [Thermoleophilia bacterium]|nr:hypothetical protein [Thermoleophilia bacterium]